MLQVRIQPRRSPPASPAWRGLVLATLASLTGAVQAADRLEQEFAGIAARCAPAVHPATLAAVVRQESRFDPLAIGVNGSPAVRVRASTLDEAVRTAEKLIAAGRSIDIGLGQINSANLQWLGITIREAFDPCTNLEAAARILAENYLRYRDDFSTDQAALDAALSAYNTGSRTGGLRNGYVAKVRAGAGVARQVAGAHAPAPRQAPAWDAFGASRAAAFAYDRRGRAGVDQARGEQ